MLLHLLCIRRWLISDQCSHINTNNFIVGIDVCLYYNIVYRHALFF